MAIVVVSKPHDAEQLLEEILEAIPFLAGAPRPDGYRDAPDGFVVATAGGVTRIEVPTDELGAMVEVVVLAHVPKGSKAAAARAKRQARLEGLKLSKNKPPNAEQWTALLDHLGIQ